LIEGVLKFCYFPEKPEMGIEIHPVVTSLQQIRDLAGIGFNRLSIGIQDFTPFILEKINRYQSFAQTLELVEEARFNLIQISAASLRISTLVKAIAQATVEQSKSSEIVTDTITDVAAIAVKTSTDTNQVSNAFKDLLEVAQKLQKSVGQFKV